MLTSIFLATLIVSLLSFIGLLVLAFKEKVLEKLTLFLVALSAGVLIGSAFLHLLPESIETNNQAFPLVITGFLAFFLIEKILHWRHCHEGKCKVHTFAYMNLIGDFFHNFLDGLIIASSFLINSSLGLTTTIAIAIHEIPQELGDFGVLIYSGMKKGKALFLNFLVALTAVLGGVVGYFLTSGVSNYITPIAAGGFIYIAASDLIPELKSKKNLLAFIIFILGIVLMWLLKLADLG